MASPTRPADPPAAPRAFTFATRANAVALCIVRGVPVLAEARRLLDEGA